MHKGEPSEHCFIGVVAAVFLRHRRRACRFTEVNVRRGSVRFGICAVFMPTVLGCGYWLRSVIGNMMTYSRVGGNKRYSFGVFGKLPCSRISVFWYRGEDGTLSLTGFKMLASLWL